jgi:hypothetical protein
MSPAFVCNTSWEVHMLRLACTGAAASLARPTIACSGGSPQALNRALALHDPHALRAALESHVNPTQLPPMFAT